MLIVSLLSVVGKYVDTSLCQCSAQCGGEVC